MALFSCCIKWNVTNSTLNTVIKLCQKQCWLWVTLTIGMTIKTMYFVIWRYDHFSSAWKIQQKLFYTEAEESGNLYKLGLTFAPGCLARKHIRVVVGINPQVEVTIASLKF